MPNYEESSWQCHKDRIADLDNQIVHLIKQRIRSEHALAGDRQAKGLPQTELAWENEVLRGYEREFGPEGSALAVLLLGLGELSRRAQPQAPPSAIIRLKR